MLDRKTDTFERISNFQESIHVGLFIPLLIFSWAQCLLGALFNPEENKIDGNIYEDDGKNTQMKLPRRKQTLILFTPHIMKAEKNSNNCTEKKTKIH